MKLLEFAVFGEGVGDVPCDTVVVPVPADERPLRADAGRLDWRVCGALSDLLAAGQAAGTRGEAVLLPAPRPLRASRILLVGLGPTKKLEGRQLQRAFALISEKLSALRASVGLLALPGALDLELDCELMVRGCMQTLSTLRGNQRLCLGVPDARRHGPALEAALSRVAPEARQRRVELSLYYAEPEPADPGIGIGSAAAS